MTYEETKALAMEVYPSLFVDEADVLHHLFFINGNGYRWTNGELTDDDTPDVTRARAKEGRERFNKEVLTGMLTRFDDFLEGLETDDPEARETVQKIQARAKERQEALIQSDDPEVERAKEIKNRLRWIETNPSKSSWFLLPDGRIGRELYPLCQYADILHTPDDVKPDWLIAAVKALTVVRSDLFRRTPSDEEWLNKAEKIIKRLMAISRIRLLSSSV